jgi:hypothetical protein
MGAGTLLAAQTARNNRVKSRRIKFPFICKISFRLASIAAFARGIHQQVKEKFGKLCGFAGAKLRLRYYPRNSSVGPKIMSPSLPEGFCFSRLGSLGLEFLHFWG